MLNKKNPASIVYLKDFATVLQDTKVKHSTLKKRLQVVKCILLDEQLILLLLLL